jgi:uncharacterized cupin superfamily protein
MSQDPFRPLCAKDVEPRAKATNYPAEYAPRVDGRIRRRLGESFGLEKFGVNLTTVLPGCQSALLHRHSRQEEFIYILAGRAVLRTQDAEFELSPGDCAGFGPGGPAHHLVNRSDEPMHYLEIGDRIADDEAEYPEDDLKATAEGNGWLFTHKDGTPW